MALLHSLLVGDVDISRGVFAYRLDEYAPSDVILPINVRTTYY